MSMGWQDAMSSLTVLIDLAICILISWPHLWISVWQQRSSRGNEYRSPPPLVTLPDERFEVVKVHSDRSMGLVEVHLRQ